MHPRVLTERSASAQARILIAAKVIAEKYHLDAPIAALEAATDRDPQVAMLKQREAVADLLESVAGKTAAPKPIEAPAPISKARVIAPPHSDAAKPKRGKQKWTSKRING